MAKNTTEPRKRSKVNRNRLEQNIQNVTRNHVLEIEKSSNGYSIQNDVEACFEDEGNVILVFPTLDKLEEWFVGLPVTGNTYDRLTKF